MGFFDRVKGTVEEAGKNISTAASDNIEIVKCNSAVKTCEAKIKELYTEIGERYYNAETDMSRADFADLFEQVQKQQSEIAGLKKKLQDLKGVEVCKICGQEISRGSRFCKWCGAAVEQEKPASSGKVCPNCHAPLNGNEIFCGECGAKIEWPQEEQSAEEQPAEEQGEPTEQIKTPAVCAVCGAPLEEADAFCKNCGAPVNK